MASLAIVVDGVEQKVPLEAAAVTLGRGLESDIRLKDIKASRRHCQVVKTSKGYQCVDLSSGNGTYVNGVQIKQQMLEPGDKITIGSTTIVFEDAPKAAAPKAAVPKAATGKVPAAPAPASPQAKTAPIKVATERVQVAPTRKATARVESAKPVSHGALKPASAVPPGKSGTRTHKTGARASGTRPPRPAAEAPKKKSPGVLIAVAAVVVLGLGAGGYFLLGSKDNTDQVRAQIDQLVKKAAESEKADKIDAALADYKKAYELCKGDTFKVRASDLQKQIQLLEAHRGGGNSPSVKPDPKDPGEKGPDFAAKRTEISARHKLADGAAADWGGALKDWRDFLKGKPGDAKTKADAEIQALLGKAKEDLGRFRKKADALAQENKMAEACDLLKQQLPRFEGSDLAELHQELEAAIKQHDK